jgi:hypothetical protein
MSFKPEVIADSSGKWCRNALCFATEKEAADWALDLSWRWINVRQHRAVACDDPATHRYIDGKLESL